MGFFHNDQKAEPTKVAAKKVNRKDIPIASLRQLGCSACPRNDDATLKSPKMRPSGVKNPMVYLLGASPSVDEDEDNMHWTDKAGSFIYRAFSKSFMDANVRSNFITQCHGPQTALEIECCRNRIVADIEQTKPLVIVGVGDEVLRWATGMVAGNSTTLVHRGSKFVVKVGNHVCWFVPIIYPNFVNKKGGFGGGEFELALKHDIAGIKEWCGGNGIETPKFYGPPYDAGIEIITGQEPGDMERLKTALDRHAKLRESSLDIETTGLRPYMLKDARILTCSVGSFNNTTAFAVDHKNGWGSKAQVNRVKLMLMEYILYSGVKCCHNLAFEMEWFEFMYGGDILRRTEWQDTMAMCHTLDERGGTKALGHQTLLHFGFNIKEQSNLDVSRLEDYPIELALKYNGMDCKWTDRLRDQLALLLAANKNYVVEAARKVRMAPTLVTMETKGLSVDIDFAIAKDKELRKSLHDIEVKLNHTEEVKRYGQQFGTFSPTNPDHVLRLMRDICKRNEVRIVDRFTKEVTWTSGEESLSAIPKAEVPSAALVLEHRGLAKLRSTYIEPLLSGKVVCMDGLVRCKYSSMVAETGRLAAETPSIQNWPKRKHKEIRGCFAPRKDHLYFAADYGQIEFRVVGMASEDDNLVKYCWVGYDVHAYWATRMMKEYPAIVDYIVDTWPEVEDAEDVDKAIFKVWRQEAKNGWVFPQLFGSSVDSCATQLHLPSDVANDLAKEFWDEFKGVKKWQNKLLRAYEKNLYTETLGGRRRRGALSKNQVLNVQIQGTAADIVTEAMVVCSEYAELVDDTEFNPSLNIHDDLTFEMRDGSVDAKMPVIAEIMCKPRFDFINVPLIVECSVGHRWSELKEIKKYSSEQLFKLRNPYE